MQFVIQFSIQIKLNLLNVPDYGLGSGFFPSCNLTLLMLRKLSVLSNLWFSRSFQRILSWIESHFVLCNVLIVFFFQFFSSIVFNDSSHIFDSEVSFGVFRGRELTVSSSKSNRICGFFGLEGRRAERGGKIVCIYPLSWIEGINKTSWKLSICSSIW